jgi:hypothetical protein
MGTALSFAEVVISLEGNRQSELAGPSEPGLGFLNQAVMEKGTFA